VVVNVRNELLDPIMHGCFGHPQAENPIALSLGQLGWTAR